MHLFNTPEIKPVKEILGKNIYFRNADVGDAGFIVELRLKKGQHLSSTSPDVTNQIKWLEGYKEGAGQAYFIICNSNHEKIGVVRLYDAKGDSFCWGSWILADNAASSSAIESMLMVYYYGLSLGFNKAHFDVRKDNFRVWKFHESFGSIRVSAAQDDYFYEISEEMIKKSLNKYKKFLPVGIEIRAI